MLLTIVEFVGFTVLVAVLSWWKTKDEDLSSKEGYFLAGRVLPGIVIAGSLMMTNLSAEQLVGTNGQAFSGSMSSMAWEATSGFALLVLAAMLIGRTMRLQDLRPGEPQKTPPAWRVLHLSFLWAAVSALLLFQRYYIEV